MNGLDYYLTHSVHPSLWAGCRGAWLPSAGNSGDRIQCEVGSSAACVMKQVGGTQNAHSWAKNSSARGGQQIVAQGDSGISYWRVPFSIGVVRQATISCWIGARSTGTNGLQYATVNSRYLISWRNDPITSWGIVQNSGSGAMWLDGAWRGTANTTWPQELRHYCLTWGPGKLLQVYYDGVVIHSHTMSGSLPASATDPHVIDLGNGFGGTGRAQWDDLRVYNRALSAREVQLLAQRPGVAYQISPRRVGLSTTSGQTITPTGIASTLALGSPTITTGAVDVSPTGIASTLALGQPTVSPDASNVSATGIASTLALGQPTITVGDVSVSPTGIASTTAIGEPTITTGAVDVSATGIASTLTMGEPTVTHGGVTIDATGIASTLALGQPTITVGDVSVSPTGIASTLAIGTPTITSGLSILPTGIASTLAIGQPTLTTGAVTVSATGIASTLALGQPVVTTGEVTVSVTGIASALAIGQPTVTVTAPTIEVTGIASTLAIGQPTVTTGDVTVSATGIGSTSAVGQPTVSLAGASQNITLTGIASTLGIGQPTVGFFVRADSSFSAGRNSTSATVKRWGN